jgi:protein involved in polysaccharide export with SLBB domain
MFSSLPVFAASSVALPSLGNNAATVTPTIGSDTVARPGQPTQSEGGVNAPTAVGNPQNAAPAPQAVEETHNLEPFGASLFEHAVPAATQSENPDYVVQIGDVVSLRVWGGVTAETSQPVDTSGNIYLTGAGPIHVAGVRAGDLQRRVSEQLSKNFTQNVQVYAALEQSHQMGVFVSGFVQSPGRYAGAASDSVLDYLLRAGGIDPSRGSYRKIAIQRHGRTLANVDLYDFLLSGGLPAAPLREDDTILVGKQNAMIAVGGAVRNNYLFEVTDPATAGHDIIALARPLPSATHAFVKGTRSGQPYAAYMSIAELGSSQLFDQDQVTFFADTPSTTVSVQVQGSRIGPSVLVADRTAILPDLLDRIAVDPRLADTKSIYILRTSAAAQQARAIQEAIERLQKSLYYAVSATTGEAAIRASEAQLITSYINTIRNVQPQGRIVVTDEEGHALPIRLEDGDVIVIPERSQTVMVAGEVRLPQAVVFDSGLTARDYIARAGGLTERGRDDNLMIVRANGALLLDADTKLKPGDELIVLPYIDTKDFQLFKDFLEVLFQAGAAGYYASHF